MEFECIEFREWFRHGFVLNRGLGNVLGELSDASVRAGRGDGR